MTKYLVAHWVGVVSWSLILVCAGEICCQTAACSVWKKAKEARSLISQVYSAWPALAALFQPISFWGRHFPQWQFCSSGRQENPRQPCGLDHRSVKFYVYVLFDLPVFQTDFDIRLHVSPFLWAFSWLSPGSSSSVQLYQHSHQGLFERVAKVSLTLVLFSREDEK